jgi:hypothetical protein
VAWVKGGGTRGTALLWMCNHAECGGERLKELRRTSKELTATITLCLFFF